MTYLCRSVTIMSLLLVSQLAYSDSITDTYTTGDTLTATILNNIKSAVNDNDGRITELEPDSNWVGPTRPVRAAGSNVPPNQFDDFNSGGRRQGTLWIDSIDQDAYISVDGGTIGGDAVWKRITDKAYEIGDVGPAGGWVFYVTADGLHGLEAAPEDLVFAGSDLAPYGCEGTDLGVPVTGMGTWGSGRINTNVIVIECPVDGTAARIADNYVSPSGYFDWYLPSNFELDKLLINLGGQSSAGHGLRVAFIYWTSNEIDITSASGITNNALSSPSFAMVSKGVGAGVRAVRAF